MTAVTVERPGQGRLSSKRVRVALIALTVMAAALPVLSLRRMPTPFADVQLYASIARARQLYGVGVPTIIWNSPVAVDHIPFYGPVFFDLAALALRTFGVSLWSFRLVSLSGAALYVFATVLLARQFTGSKDRMLLAALLALLSPEVNFGAATGAMHMLAVGFQVLALAAFVTDVDRTSGAIQAGASAGLWLALAALTTPRSYPFVCAFFCAGWASVVFKDARRAIAHRLLAAGVVLAVIMGSWASISHGSVISWVRYLADIFTHEDTDVALLPTAVRTFSFHVSGVLTPGVAIASGLLAAWSIHRLRDAPRLQPELAFVLVCGWIDLVVTVAVLNYTFTIGEYVALPLFSVIVAWPWERAPAARRVVVAGLCGVLALDAGHVIYRYASVAPVWRAHDPAPVNAFIARYVPRGSTVVGPNEPFFFPVETSGSRYVVTSPRSWADWARWVPDLEPAETTLASHIPTPPGRERFLLWPEDDLPDGYQCASGGRIATYVAPAPGREWPSWVLRRATSHPDPGYPSVVLYRLPEGCPVGYDPTRVSDPAPR